MKLAMNMIRQYADIPVTPEEYTQRMIMTGTAVEATEDISGGMEKVVVGRVLTCEDVEGTHLHECTVDVGGPETLHIVCGAPNVAAGQLVPVALDGAHLPGGVKIKKGKLRGLISEGMICSGEELHVPTELYPNIEEKGILVFHEDYPLGADVKPILGIDDTAVDFEILANRPDCLCAIGIARETAAALDTEFRAPKITVTEAGGDIHDEVKVRVEAPDLCPRYAARLLTGMGYLEVMNFSFTGIREIQKLGLPEGDLRNDPMPILNPLGEDAAVMRPTLACGMLRTLAFNMNHSTPAARLYEAAAVFDHHHRTDEGLPTETQTLCLGAYGPEEDFFTVRGAVEAILRAGGIACEVEAGGDAYYHPGRCARLTRGGVTFAVVGEVHPDVRERFDMPRRAVMAEINLQTLLTYFRPMGEMKPLPRFPAVQRDLALVMEEGVAVGPLMADMRRAAGKLLESMELFDVYRGAQVAAGHKSVAFSLTFRASDRTLTDEEVQAAMDKVTRVCAEKHGATVRA